ASCRNYRIGDDLYLSNGKCECRPHSSDAGLQQAFGQPIAKPCRPPSEESIERPNPQILARSPPRRTTKESRKTGGKKRSGCASGGSDHAGIRTSPREGPTRSPVARGLI